MNFDPIANAFTDAIHASSTDDVNLLVASEVSASFGISPDAHRGRVRANERRYVFDEEDGRILVLEDTAAFKLALAGKNEFAEAFKVWVSGDLVPLLYLANFYGTSDKDRDELELVVREKGSMTALRIAALSYAALSGEGPEDRAFQDYLAEVVLPELLAEGRYVVANHADRFSDAFQQLTAFR